MTINTDSPMNAPFPWEDDAERDISQPPPAGEEPTIERTISDPPDEDDDIIDAEIVEDDEPQPDALAVSLANDTRDVTLSYRDPDAVAAFAIGLRRAIREDVRATMHQAARDRIETDRPTPEAYAAEFQVAADVAETLTEVADALRSGVEVAHDHAAMLLDDVTDPAKRTRSVRVGDGHGRDLKVGLVQGSALSVDQDAILDLIAQDVAAGAEGMGTADVARDALRVLLSLISGPSWKSTALDAWKRGLEDDGRHAEAITLGHAYGRIDKGEPRFKIERVDRTKRGAK